MTIKRYIVLESEVETTISVNNALEEMGTETILEWLRSRGNNFEMPGRVESLVDKLVTFRVVDFDSLSISKLKKIVDNL